MTERENALKVFRGELPDWIPCYTKATAYLFSDYTEAEKPQNYEGYDWFGVHWLPVAATANLTHPDIRQKPLISDISEWRDQLKLPDVDALDWAKISEQLNAQCDEIGDSRIFTIMLEHGMFERLTLLMGFENALMALYDDPEACQDYCEAMADFKISVIDHLVAACPRIEMLDWHDDLGSQSAALMSPDKWEEIFAASTARVAKHVRDIGRLYMYHSCGRIDQIMDRVLEHVKPDGWNVLQACNDQPYIKKQFGKKVVLVSGLDTQNYVDIPNPEEAAEYRKSTETAGSGMSILDVLKTKQTWLIAVPFGILYMTAVGVMSQLIPRLMSQGFDMPGAMFVMSVASLIGVAGSYVYGWIDVKFGVKKSSVIIMLDFIVAMFLMILPFNVITMWISMVLVGAGLGGVANLSASFAASVFGPSGFAKAFSVINPLMGIIRVTATSMLAFGLTYLGGYSGAYTVFLVLCVIALILTVLASDKPLEAKR